MSDALSALLSDLRREAGWENSSGATNAALAVAQLEGEEPIKALVTELERVDRIDLTEDGGDMGDEVWRTRQAIEAGLIAMGARAVKFCAPLLHSASMSGRDRVLARVCAKGKATRVFPVLEAWLQNDDDSSQNTAIDCLGELGDDRGRALIRKALEKPIELNAGWRKRIAAGALAKLQDAEALHVLLDDTDWFARLGVLEAVKHLQNPHDRAQLIARGKTDVDERVRKAANETLPLPAKRVGVRGVNEP